MKTHERFVGAFACLAIAALGGCTLLLDFAAECASDEDCGGGSCVQGICEVAGGDTGTDAGGDNNGGGDAGGEGRTVVIESNVIEDTTWSADITYELKSVVTVLPGVTLTIEPGTTILGGRNSALVVREGGVLEAAGTREAPIVFTSNKPEGQRAPGDWGGVALLGKAPVNRENATLNILTDELEARFGGPDEDWHCGTLSYVRIEFGGGQVNGEEALNGLTLAGCGKETLVDHVHIHFGADDGLELFGGTVDIKYVAVTRAQDDGIDIDLGWRGTGQYLAVQMDAAGDNGIESDNLSEDPTATPLTEFTISNFTILGPGENGLTRGITLKAGSAGHFTHGIVMGHPLEAVDVFGAEAGEQGNQGNITILNTLFFDIGEDGSSYFPVTGEDGETGIPVEDGDDAGFEEGDVFTAMDTNNKFDVDPGIDAVYDNVNPGWVPDSAPVVDVDRPPTGFEQQAVFRGAFTPGVDPWTEDWTDFPGG